jgi:hypothetical protein
MSGETIRRYGIAIGFVAGFFFGQYTGMRGRILESTAEKEKHQVRVETILEYAPQRAYLGDVDRDGYADIVVRNGTQNPYAFLNNWADQFYSEGELTDNGKSAGIMRERAFEAELRPDFVISGHPPVWTVKVAEKIAQMKNSTSQPSIPNQNCKEVEKR